VEAQTATQQPTVVILADDLIWASRLVAATKNAEAIASAARTPAELDARLADAPAGSPVIVDLNGRGYDGVEQVRAAAARGHRVLAVGQHEDLELRKRALAAGAVRVLSYNKLFTDGPNVVARLIAGDL
jgi:DNA-binding NarL/FixJ family response regulator